MKRTRRGDQFVEGDSSRFGIRIVRLDNGKCIEIVVNRTLTLKKVLELIKQDESKTLVALLS